MNYNERYLQVEFSGVRLPAALTLPRESAPKWGIVLVPGSFNSDLDGNYTKKDGNPFEARPHTYVDLAGQLAGRGLAVLRYGRAGRTVVDPDKAAASAKFAARKARDLPVSRAVFPELNHFYKVVPPDTPPQMNFGLETGTDERVARAISDWLDSLAP